MTPSYHRPKQKAREQRGTKQCGANGLEQSNAEQSKAIRTSDSVAPRSGLGHDIEEEERGYGNPLRLSSKERGRHHDRNVTMNWMVFKTIGS